MANKKLFTSAALRPPKADTRNLAGGRAYSRNAEDELAQIAVTGFFGGTFYDKPEDQLERVLELAKKVEPAFLAKLAIYARREGFMKDMPAALLAVLSTKDTGYFKRAFPRVIDNGRMVRTFVQIMRSGATGRKSLGSSPRAQVRKYLRSREPAKLFNDAVGNSPAIADLIKMTHPRPMDAAQEGLFGYIIGKAKPDAELPEVIQQFEDFKSGVTTTVPQGIEFRRLTALPLTKSHWAQIARNAPWHMTRMNLNTFARNGVFEGISGQAITDIIAARLRNPEIIAKVKAFPYQLMAAYLNVDEAVPREITLALQDAMEIACSNIPKFTGKIYIFPDVSGSMGCSVSGRWTTAASKIRCIDVASLFASAIARVNPTAVIMPFDTGVHSTKSLNPRDSVITNAEKLRQFGGGGTNCSLPLVQLNKKGALGDLIIYISDSESWVDGGHHWGGTGTMAAWNIFKRRNKGAKMVCINLIPNGTVQAKNDPDVLNVGGFSDRVFKVIESFTKNTGADEHYWTNLIRSVEL